MTQFYGSAIATLVVLYTGLSLAPAGANDIIPAANSTGTQVTPQGSDHLITGGATSADQQNLFHQFTEFNLSTGASATFLTDPAVLNILSGVNGANPSVIDGLLQVSGSTANLYLINPNGILFGPNAALNLQGGFTALTADQVGFAQDELDLVGANDYAALVGPPQSFSFSLGQPASVVNAGNLQVPAGEAVVLVGGQVLNTGTITAPGGNILVSAVAGGSRVRLAQTGQLLNLELAALPEASRTTGLPFSPLGLPELLTGHAIAAATNVTVNADGTITLGTADLAIPTTPETTIISGQLQTDSGQTGGAVTVLGETVGLLGATVSATGATGGGTIRVGGDYTGGGLLPTASITVVDAASSLVAEAIAQGDGGTIILWSEATTRSDGFLSARGGRLGGDGGLVETSSRGFLATTGVPDITAPQGQAGHWLLDPWNVRIVDAASSQTTGFPANNPFVAQSSPAVISWLDIERALSDGGTVTITTGSTGNQAGNIDVDGFDLDTNADSTLVLRAATDIRINGAVSSISGATDFDFRADADGNGNGEVTIAAPLASGGGDITLKGTTVFVTSGGAIAPQGGILTVTETGQTACPDGCQNPPPDGPEAPEGNDFGFEGDDFGFEGDDFGGPDDFGGDDFGGDDFGDGPDDFRDGPDDFGDGPDDFGGDDFGFEGDDFGDGPDDFGDGPDDFDDGPERRERRAGREEEDGPEGDRDANDFEDGDEFAEEQSGREFGDRDFDANAEDLSGEDWAFEDGLYAEDFVSYFDLPVLPEPNFAASQDTLQTLTQQVGTASALVYARFIPAGGTVVSRSPLKQLPDPQPTDVLQLVVVTPDGQPQQIEVPEATREKVVVAVRRLQIELTDRTRRRLTDYLQYSQQLYDWLIVPIEPALVAADIGHVSMIMAPGLRSLPLAALHDGEQFIIENYSVGLMPSLALTDTRYTDVRRAPVLAMGASEFTDQPALPAVPFELSNIVGNLRQGRRNLNESFTPQTLVSARQAEDYQILHLATHGEFRPGGPANSYIQFWDERLSLAQIPELQLNDPPLELLVMSACKTALGDPAAELGFAGLAVQAGVRSALASLWQVSDLETAGLMAEFYTQLGQQPYKAEALRQAQLAMLRGEVTVQDGVLTWSASAVPLPDELVTLRFGNTQHPYYWAAFTLVGSPW